MEREQEEGVKERTRTFLTEMRVIEIKLLNTSSIFCWDYDMSRNVCRCLSYSPANFFFFLFGKNCSKLSAILLALNSFLHHLCPGKDNYHQNSSGNAPLLKPLHYCSYVCTFSLFCHFFWKDKGFE